MALLAVLGLGPSPAKADRASLESASLSWVRLPGAEDCAGAHTLARVIEHRLGRPVFVAAAEAHHLVEGYVQPRGNGGWQAHLSVRSEEGEVLGKRDLHVRGEDCSVLTEPLTLVIALTLYPDATSMLAPVPEDDFDWDAWAARHHRPSRRNEAPPDDTEPRDEPESEPRPTRPATPAESRPQEPSLLQRDERGQSPKLASEGAPLTIYVGGIAGIGQLPSLRPGGMLGIALEPEDAWALELAGRLWLPTEAAAEQQGSAELRLLELRGTICPLVWPWSRAVRLTGCAGVLFGVMQAQAREFTSSNGTMGHLLAGPELLARWELEIFSWLTLRAAVSMAVPLARPRFTYEDRFGIEQVLFEVSPVLTSLELGLGAHFR